MSSIRLIHLADIHLGFTSPASLLVDSTENEKAAGRYQREIDIEMAVDSMSKAIIAAQPAVDMVVIAGDLFHKSAPYPRATSMAARMVGRLVKKDIAVVIIDGNHESSSVLHTGSPTTFLKELGAYVVNGAEYVVLRDTWNKVAPETRTRLAPLAIHALPYRAVMQRQFDGVHPLTGYINVLLTHGRIAGMDEPNTLHRSSSDIPTTVLRHGWDYVALGDWHIHRYQPLSNVPAFYAGSLEGLNYGEAAMYPALPADKYTVRGALDVRLTLDRPAEVLSYPHTGARPVLRLYPIDATDMDADALMDLLRKRLRVDLPSQALVVLHVNNCPVQTWEQLDQTEIADLRKHVRRCDIRWDIKRPSLDPSQNALSEMAIESQWQHFMEQQEPDEIQRAWYVEQGMQRIDNARTAMLAADADAGESK